MENLYFTYPAILKHASDGITVEFPDLPGCLTCGFTEEQAFKNAKEALGLHLFGMEQDHETLPGPSPLSSVSLKDGEALALIEVFMPAVRDRINNRFVKKTLSIPAWLNRLGEQEHVNFSHVLQEGLKKHLGIHS